MSSLARSPRRLFVALLAGILAFFPATGASADQAAPAVFEQSEIAELVTRILAELGVAPDADDPMDDLLERVAVRLAVLVDEGVVEPDQVDALGDLVEAGAFDDVTTTVEAARERRDAVREATRSILEALGIEIPADGSLQEAIDAAGLTRDRLAELLEESGIELPPHPTPVPPAPPAPKPAPTTTRPPAPAPEPDPTPAAERSDPSAYPETSPQPRPAYPTNGGQGNEPQPPPRPEYPTTGQDSAATDGEDSL